MKTANDQDRETRRQYARIRNAFSSMPYGPAAGIRTGSELPTLKKIGDDLEKLRGAITRGAINLGKLDAHGLALLREILLQVLDDGCTCAKDHHPWQMFEVSETVTEAKANEQRLRFCDEVQKQITRATMPATLSEPLVSHELVKGLDRIEDAVDRIRA